MKIIQHYLCTHCELDVEEDSRQRHHYENHLEIPYDEKFFKSSYQSMPMKKVDCQICGFEVESRTVAQGMKYHRAVSHAHMESYRDLFDETKAIDITAVKCKKCGKFIEKNRLEKSPNCPHGLPKTLRMMNQKPHQVMHKRSIEKRIPILPEKLPNEPGTFNLCPHCGIYVKELFSRSHHSENHNDIPFDSKPYEKAFSCRNRTTHVFCSKCDDFVEYEKDMKKHLESQHPKACDSIFDFDETLKKLKFYCFNCMQSVEKSQLSKYPVCPHRLLDKTAEQELPPVQIEGDKTTQIKQPKIARSTEPTDDENYYKCIHCMFYVEEGSMKKHYEENHVDVRYEEESYDKICRSIKVRYVNCLACGIQVTRSNDLIRGMESHQKCFHPEIKNYQTLFDYDSIKDGIAIKCGNCFEFIERNKLEKYPMCPHHTPSEIHSDDVNKLTFSNMPFPDTITIPGAYSKCLQCNEYVSHIKKIKHYRDNHSDSPYASNSYVPAFTCKHIKRAACKVCGSYVECEFHLVIERHMRLHQEKKHPGEKSLDKLFDLDKRIDYITFECPLCLRFIEKSQLKKYTECPHEPTNKEETQSQADCILSQMERGESPLEVGIYLQCPHCSVYVMTNVARKHHSRYHSNIEYEFKSYTSVFAIDLMSTSVKCKICNKKLVAGTRDQRQRHRKLKHPEYKTSKFLYIRELASKKLRCLKCESFIGLRTFSEYPLCPHKSKVGPINHKSELGEVKKIEYEPEPETLRKSESKKRHAEPLESEAKIPKRNEDAEVTSTIDRRGKNAESDEFHVKCKICDKKVHSDKMEQHMKRKHPISLRLQPNSGLKSHGDITKVKIEQASESESESDAEPSTTHRVETSTTIEQSVPKQKTIETEFYPVLVSKDELAKFLTQNRIYPKDGQFYLKDS